MEEEATTMKKVCPICGEIWNGETFTNGKQVESCCQRCGFVFGGDKMWDERNKNTRNEMKESGIKYQSEVCFNRYTEPILLIKFTQRVPNQIGCDSGKTVIFALLTQHSIYVT